MPMTPEELIPILAKQIGAFPSVEKVILFGSYATGRAGPYVSDIDFAVTGVRDDEGMDADTVFCRRRSDVVESRRRTV
jgi:predicted nucleotidyltransferase